MDAWHTPPTCKPSARPEVDRRHFFRDKDSKAAKNCNLPASICLLHGLQKEATEQTGENFDGKKETWPARDPPPANA